MVEKSNEEAKTTSYLVHHDKFVMHIQMHLCTFLQFSSVWLMHYYSKPEYYSAPIQHIRFYAAPISLSAGIFLNRCLTALLYSRPELNIEILEGNTNNMLMWLPKIHKYLENFLDKNKDLKYVADSFHISVVIKSGMVTFLTTSLINSYMNPGKYKAILIPLVASLASYEMWYYFQDPEEQLIAAINSKNYARVDAIINYRMPQDKIADVIDILSQNIKCTEMKEWHCNAAIETALKLVNRSIDTASRNKSIKFAVSLALSVGEGSKISDEVFNKISDYESFSKIIDMISYAISMDEREEIRHSAIDLVYRLSRINGWSYDAANENGGKALNNIVQYLLKLDELGLKHLEQVEKLHDSINKILNKCHSNDCTIKALNVMIGAGKANEISEYVINNIKDSETFSEIIDVVKGYLYGDKYDLKIKDGAINFLLRMSDKIPKELIPKSIEVLLPIGEANEISEEVLNKIEGSKAFSEIMDKISSVIRIDSSEKTIYSAIDLVYRLSKINEWSYDAANENGGNALNNIVQYLLKLDELGLRYIDKVKKLHDSINNILNKCQTNDCTIKGLDVMIAAGKANKVSDDVLNKISDESFSKIIEKTSYAISMDEREEIRHSAIDLVYRLSRINGWSYEASNEKGGNALHNIVQYLLKLDELGLRYLEQVKKLHDSINNILNKCVDNNSLFKGVEILLSSGKLKPISDLTISNIGNVDLYRKILEKLIIYDENNSTSNVINEFASSLLSNCGEKCIGHAMELFYKNGDFKKQIEPFKSKFHIAESVNELLIKIDNETVKTQFELEEDRKPKLNKKLSLEETILKYVFSKVESGINAKISAEIDCIKEVKGQLHNMFYENNIDTPFNLFDFLEERIIYCDDLSKISSNPSESLSSDNSESVGYEYHVV